MMASQSKKIFSLEMSRENERIKISAYEKSSDDQKTVRHYEFKDIYDDEIKKMCADVVVILNRANRHGKIDTENLKALQTAGQLLYDSLLTGRVKELLTATDAEHLIISIDDQLVQIPWEILFDGKNFLCQRFSMGRLVSTSQRSSEPATRKVRKPIKMLVIADPRGDLRESYNEGIRLRNALDHHQEIIEVDLKSRFVDVRYIKGTLRDFDILHYAGHADYDIHNPSDSGFLLQEGKFKAADIMNMIGPTPLPLMVFSNACRSGRTDMWTVGEDYETEIYGLANAFLLAGVQHYIGTFWDVQDEPSLHFAIDFYEVLINGAMVGEAIRRARQRLIERYGEETITWASYMLYGDPTVRYAASPQREEDFPDVEKTAMEVGAGDGALHGSLRGAEEVVAFPPKRSGLILRASLLFVAVAVIVTSVIFIRNKDFPEEKAQVVTASEPAEEKEKRVNGLISSLIEQYYQDRAHGKQQAQHVKKAGVPTVVFLDIMNDGISKTDYDYILTRITGNLKRSKRVNVIEREIIDKLLKELRLGSSELANPETSLRIGRILSAHLISVGSITRKDNEWQVSLRFIETETSSIKAALAEIIEAEDKISAADKLGAEILKSIRTAYPLQGKILSLDAEAVVLDIGYRAGLRSGMKLKVLSGEHGNEVGELEVISANENTSAAKIVSQRSAMQKGFRVEEFL